MNKKALFAHEKGLFLIKKDLFKKKKKKGFDHRENRFAFIHKRNSGQIATANSHGK